MKTVIYYFSGTGNSLSMARELGAELGGAELVHMAAALRGGVAVDADRIGLVFPVYMWGLPLMAARFAEKLSGLGAKYVFAVATMGGSAGLTLQQLDGILRRGGAHLSCGFNVKMPGNYIPMKGAQPPEEVAAIIEAARSRVKDMARTIQSGAEGLIEQGPWYSRLLSGAVYAMGSKRLNGMDEKFFADAKCTSCGLCAKLCPVENIVMKDGRPCWQHRCEQCMACIQWCPVSAIQYGRATESRSRYRHPQVKAEDLLAH